MRRVASLLVALGVCLVAGCGTSRPALRTSSAHRFVACASTDCGAYAINLNWGTISWAFSTTGYDLFLNGSQVGSTVNSPYSFTGMDCGTTFLLGVKAHDGSGHVSQLYTTPYSTPPCPGNYNQQVLADGPVAFWAMNGSGGTETDLTGNGHTGTYVGGALTQTVMPNGNPVNILNHSATTGQYMKVSPDPVFSEPTTGLLTVVAWVKTETLQPANLANSSYVEIVDKCPNYGSPATCEWELRMYAQNNNGHETPNRPNRFSDYIFNPSAGLGVSADWQPEATDLTTYLTQNTVVAGNWYMVVAEYDSAFNTAWYPFNSGGTSGGYNGGCDVTKGTDNIWINGVPWDQHGHGDTGCYSQHSIVPQAVNPPNASCTTPVNCEVRVGTMVLGDNAWWNGPIGKVAVFDSLLSQAQINVLFQDMAGSSPNGTCTNAPVGDSEKNDCTLGAQVP